MGKYSFSRRSRKVLEQKHRSSNVIEKSGDNFVKTVCCIYQLCGDFIEGNGRTSDLLLNVCLYYSFI